MPKRRVDIADDAESDPHRHAAETFGYRVRERPVGGVEDLYLFGSTVRGDRSGVDSDVDFLAIVADDTDRKAVADELRDVAYDVMLAFGPVVEVHVLSRTEFERRREQGNPFVKNVLREGRSYA